MKSTNDKSLIIKKENFLEKVISIFNRIFFKEKVCNEENYNVIKKDIQKKKNSFSESLQIDKTTVKLSNIQVELSKQGINEKNLNNLIKDLSYEEMEQLKKLYIKQNENIKNEIESFKKKILFIKMGT